MDRKLRNVARQPISGRAGKVWGRWLAAYGVMAVCAPFASPCRILISHRQARASSCAHVRLPAGGRIRPVSLFAIHSAHLSRYVSRWLMAECVKTETLAAQAESHRERSPQQGTLDESSGKFPHRIHLVQARRLDRQRWARDKFLQTCLSRGRKNETYTNTTHHRTPSLYKGWNKSLL
jgi:hypothetical protein